MFLALKRRDAVNLFGIEDGVDPMNGAVLLIRRAVRRTIRILPPRRFARWEFPVLDLTAFLALPNLPTAFSGLFVGEPARVVVTAFDSRRHQVDGIAATVCFLGCRIERH